MSFAHYGLLIEFPLGLQIYKLLTGISIPCETVSRLNPISNTSQEIRNIPHCLFALELYSFHIADETKCEFNLFDNKRLLLNTYLEAKVFCLFQVEKCEQPKNQPNNRKCVCAVARLCVQAFNAIQVVH